MIDRARAPRRSIALVLSLAVVAPFVLGGCRAARAREAYREMDEKVDALTNRVSRLEAQVEALQRAK